MTPLEDSGATNSDRRTHCPTVTFEADPRRWKALAVLALV
jgi:hypothetical protein